MNILFLSKKNNKKMYSELSELGVLIDKISNDLKSDSLNKRFRIKYFAFCCIKNDRNLIYHIHGSYSWYLKIPRKGKTVIEKEIVGFEKVKESFSSSIAYMSPEIVGYSFVSGYIICPEISGILMNIYFYRSCVFPFLSKKKDLSKLFYELGNNIAELHSVENISNLPVSDRNPFAIDTARNSFPDTKDIELWEMIHEWKEKKQNFITENDEMNFVHGNFSLENIIFSQGKSSFIDFENCGQGSPYEDLSLICLPLFLTRTLPFFPFSKSFETLSSFLAGYKLIRKLDTKLLGIYITMRLLRYYLNNNFKNPKVAGLPVLQYRLKRMVTFSINNDINIFIPNI